MSLRDNRLKLIVAILKKRFGNLGAEELIDLAIQILNAMETASE